MFNEGNFFTQKRNNFDLTEIKRKKNFVGMKSTFFANFVGNKIVIFSKITDLKEQKQIFSYSKSSFRHFHYLFTCVALIIKL